MSPLVPVWNAARARVTEFSRARGTTSYLATVVRWTRRGAWAVVDQALFAGSNFLINVLLARWLPPREYGAFVAAFSILLLLGVGHAAMFIEPMMVFAPARYAQRFGAYFESLLLFQRRFLAALAAVLAMVAAGLYAGGRPLAGAGLAGLACGGPFLLSNWFARRACYTQERPDLAAAGGAVYLSIMCAGALGLYYSGSLSTLTAQLLMGGAAFVSTAVILRSLRRTRAGDSHAATLTSVWREHWTFGRWSAASGVLFWAQGYLFFLLLPIFGGLEATAALRALMNCVMPVLQSDSALVTLLMAPFARARYQPGVLARLVKWSGRAFAVEALTYWALLAVTQERLLWWLYGGKYSEYGSLILVLGALPVLGGRLNVYGAALRALERPQYVCVAAGCAAIVSSSVGVAAMWARGLEGAVWTLVASCLVQVLVLAYFLFPLLSTLESEHAAATVC